jgi:hypothetical protein
VVPNSTIPPAPAVAVADDDVSPELDVAVLLASASPPAPLSPTFWLKPPAPPVAAAEDKAFPAPLDIALLVAVA